MKEKFYKKTWFIVLTLFIFAPLGIFLMFRYKHWKLPIKITLALFFALIFIITITAEKTDSKQSLAAKTVSEKTTDKDSDKENISDDTSKNNDIEKTNNTTEQPPTDNLSSPLSTQADSTDIETAMDVPEPHEGAAGKSDKNIDDIEKKLTPLKINNDVTGNWRVTLISNNADISKYAFSYYNKYFKSDKEIHFIVNYELNTTTSIKNLRAGFLDVTTYEYIEGEELDAEIIAGGMLYKEYFIYKDNGDIEEIQ